MKRIAIFAATLLVSMALASDQIKGNAGGVDRDHRILFVLVDGVKKEVRITDNTKFEMGDGSPTDDPIDLSEPFWNLHRLKLTVDGEMKDGSFCAAKVHLGITRHAGSPVKDVLPPKHKGPDSASLLDKPIPPFALPTIDGKTISNRSLLGKVVVIDYWATWCVPCKAVSPFIQELSKKDGGRGLVVLGVNCFEKPDNKTSAPSATYAKRHGYTYSFAFRADDLAQKCFVEEIPSILLVDRKGVIRKVQVGWHPGDDKLLEAAIEALLEK